MDVEDEEEDDDVEERKPIPRPGSTLCASLRGRNAMGRSQDNGQVTRAILGGNDRKNSRSRFLGHRFVRACAVDTHMDI